MECSICLQEFNNNFIIFECNHKFHASCILDNIHSIQTCPLCREIIISNSFLNNSIYYNGYRIKIKEINYMNININDTIFWIIFWIIYIILLYILYKYITVKMVIYFIGIYIFMNILISKILL